MSMSRKAYTLSYFLTQGCYSFVSAILVTVGLMWQFNNPQNIAGSPRIVLGASILFGFALIAFSMTLSTLFSDSKLSPQVGMYILLLPTSIYFYVMTNRVNILGRFNPTLGYELFPLWYLFPNFSFSVIMLDFYIKGAPKILLGLSTEFAWWCLLLATPFYLLLYMYLDGVIPNAYGISESLVFCCKCRKKAQIYRDQNESLVE